MRDSNWEMGFGGSIRNGGNSTNPIVALVALAAATLLLWAFLSTVDDIYAGEPRWHGQQKVKAINLVEENRAEESGGAFLARREAAYEAARNRIGEVCKKHGGVLSSRNSIGSRLVYDVKHKLGYCRHGKTGTSTWLEHFLQLSDLSTENKSALSGNPHELHTTVPKELKVPGQNSKEFDVDGFAEDHSILMFSFVRHPFDRIISAYVNKVEKWDQSSGKNRGVRDKLVKGYGEVTFSNFVRYVLDKAKSFGCPLDPMICGRLNVHWRPFFARCGYCDVRYDVVGTTETFHDDARYIAVKSGLASVMPVDEKLNSYADEDEDEEGRINQRFNELDPGLRRQLYELYRIDFEMFGYDAEPYLT